MSHTGKKYGRPKTTRDILILITLFFLATGNTVAQVTTEKEPKKNSEEISTKQRFGIRTNTVDWLLTVPNVSVEFDLGKTIRDKRTLSLGLKYNWDTSHKINPPQVFNLFDARVEWRQYFRTRQRFGSVSKDAGLFTRLKETVLTTKRKNPRTERAYFWGIYANASSYSFKFGDEGKQGKAYGAGLSLGYTAPLYGYDKGYIDIEMGGSIGLVYNSYDVYTHDSESNIYIMSPEKSKEGHLVPFPVITDVRVAFVYRFMSVSEKYKASIERRIDRINDARNKVNAEINKMRFRIDSIDSAVRKKGGSGPDSLLNKEELKQWKLMKQERAAEQKKQQEEQLRKEAAASLGIVLSDTLTNKQEKAIREEVKKRKEEAEDALEPKKEKKEKKGKKDKEEQMEAENQAETNNAVTGNDGEAQDNPDGKKAKKEKKQKKEKKEKVKEEKPKKAKKDKKDKETGQPDEGNSETTKIEEGES